MTAFSSPGMQSLPRTAQTNAMPAMAKSCDVLALLRIAQWHFLKKGLNVLSLFRWVFFWPFLLLPPSAHKIRHKECEIEIKKNGGRRRWGYFSTEVQVFVLFSLQSCLDCLNPACRIWASENRVISGCLCDPCPQEIRATAQAAGDWSPGRGRYHFGLIKLVIVNCQCLLDSESAALLCLNLSHDCNRYCIDFIGQWIADDQFVQISKDDDELDTCWPIRRCSSW